MCDSRSIYPFLLSFANTVMSRPPPLCSYCVDLESRAAIRRKWKQTKNKEPIVDGNRDECKVKISKDKQETGSIGASKPWSLIADCVGSRNITCDDAR